MKKLVLIILAFVFLHGPCTGQSPLVKGLRVIDEQALEAQLRFLSADYMRGRYPGSEESFMAADYIASLMATFGLKPAGDVVNLLTGERSYFQDFHVVNVVDTDEHELLVSLDNGKRKLSLAMHTDFDISPTAISTWKEGDLVFAGYGIRDTEKGYDDFKGLDVKGKFIIRLIGYPGHLDETSPAYSLFTDADGKRIASTWTSEKNRVAQELGVAGIIDIRPDRMTRHWASNYPFRHKTRFGEFKEPTIMRFTRERFVLQEDMLDNRMLHIDMSRRVSDFMFEQAGINPELLEQQMAWQLKTASVPMRGIGIQVSVNVKTELIRLRNVIGMLEGDDPQKYAVIGGHYDHVGEFNGFIFNGADDNASGTIGVLNIARAFVEAAVKPRHNVLFAAWDAEEKGFLGSRHFVANPFDDIEKCMLYLNFDMISRDVATDSLGVQMSVQYCSDHPKIRNTVEEINLEHAFGMDVSYYGYAPGGGGASDYVPFSREAVPFLGFMAGVHTDYHTPNDTYDKANYQKMNTIIRLGFISAWHLIMKN